MSNRGTRPGAVAAASSSSRQHPHGSARGQPQQQQQQQQQPNPNAWMDALWELHCGTPLSNAVRYTDPIVEAMWGVFQPLLGQLDVYPLSIPEATPEFVTTSTAPTVAFTDFIVLSLVDPAERVQPHRPRTHRQPHPHSGHATAAGAAQEQQRGDDRDDAAMHGDAMGVDELGNTMTAAMRTAMLEQPKIVLALVEFFTAVWLYQYEARQRQPANAHAAVALRRVYAAVSGDVRRATAFDHIGAAQLGRLLTIKGTIVRMSPTRISCLRMAYRCGLCGIVKEQHTEDGVLAYPGPCASSRCRGYKWVPLPEQALCEEVQLLRLQEHTTFFDASPAAASGAAAAGGSGGMHVMIEVELRPPWLDAVTVGDGVCVCGVLETRRGEGKQGGGMQQVCLRARAVHNLNSHGGGGGGSSSGSSSSGGGSALTGYGVAVLQHRQRNASSLFSNVASGMGSGGGGADDPWRLTRNSSGAGGGWTGLLGNSADSLDGGGEGGEAQAAGGVGAAAMRASAAAPLHAAGGGGVGVALPGSGLDSWSAEETGRFYEMARHPQWFARLTASVAPSIFGMELVKQALLLAIVGGNRDKNGGETRSSIHVLLVGDPGLGKSQLLRAACVVAPRSAFVCTHTSSSCGLTMTLTRDPVSGETTFEAGAVVHGDGGITCLDEIDKGVQEHKALLEVMEQETVSLAKAGMIFSMPVHTSVLAAGNPIGGSFDVSKSLAANVNLSPALMSRFDIIACLRNPHGTSGKAQQALTDHVLQWHRQTAAPNNKSSGSNRRSSTSRGGATATAYEADDNGGGRYSTSSSPTATRQSHAAAALPVNLVRRFLLFCRSQCQPTLGSEAGDVLLAHYLAQRQHLPEPQRGSAVAMEGTVTPRYLQALIRVAEARAKLELRHDVTRDDAEYAVQLLQSCLHSFDGLAAPGSAGVGTAGGGGATGKKSAKLNQRDTIVQRLKQMIVEENGGTNLFSEQTILDVCESAGCRSAQAMFRQLSDYGLLLQKGPSTYCLRGC